MVFLSAVGYVQNTLTSPAPEQNKEAVSVPADFHPNPLQVHPGVPELSAAAAQVKAAVTDTTRPAAIPGIEELKMKQGAVAELKKKQREELKQMKVSSKPETRSAIEAKKKEYRQAVQSLKDAQKKEMAQFKKDRKVITRKKNGRKFKITVGETFQVSLPESPSAGYQWKVYKSGAPFVDLEKEEYVEPEEDLAMPIAGRGGTKFLTFKAAKLGETELALRLRRSWEDESKFADFFSVKLKIVDLQK